MLKRPTKSSLLNLFYCKFAIIKVRERTLKSFLPYNNIRRNSNLNTKQNQTKFTVLDSIITLHPRERENNKEIKAMRNRERKT